MIGNALRISAFCNSDDFLRHDKSLLFNDLEITDHIDCGLRSDQSKFVQFVILEELVGDLYYSLFAIQFAGEVDADGDLTLDPAES